MMFRRLSLSLAKYLAISLCVLSLLLTTPFGTQLSLFLVNLTTVISVDYRSGALVRDLALNRFALELEHLTIELETVESDIDFSCTWKKKLCINSLSAGKFYLNYHHDGNEIEKGVDNKTNNDLVELPFAIAAQQVTLLESKIRVNETELIIEKFYSQINIDKSHFSFEQPSAQFLSVNLPASADKSAVRAELELPHLSLPLQLTVKQLSLAELLIHTTEQVKSQCISTCEMISKTKWHAFDNELTGTWQATQVNISHLQSSTVDVSVQQLVADIELTPPYQLDISLNSQIRQLEWWPQIVGDEQKITLLGSLDEVNFNAKNIGELALTTDGVIDFIDANMPFNIELSSQRFPMPLSLAKHAKSSSLQASISGDLKQQVLQLSSQLSSYGYQDAKLTFDGRHQQGKFEIENFNVIEAHSQSELRVHGDLSLLPEEFSWQLSAQSAGLVLPEINVVQLFALLNMADLKESAVIDLPETLSGKVHGNITSSGGWAEDNWNIRLANTDISGFINNNPISLRGDIGLNNAGHLQSGKIFAAFNHSELNVDSIATDTAGWHVTGQLTIEDVNYWNQSIQGEFTSDFTVIGAIENPLISLNSEAKQLSWRKQWLSKSLSISGEYQPNQGHEIKLSVKNDSLQSLVDQQEFSFNHAEFNLYGNAKNHTIEAKWQGDYATNIAVKGHFNHELSQWQSEVVQSELSYKNIKFNHDKPFSIAADLVNKHIDISAHCWQSLGLKACLPDQVSLGESGNFLVKLEADISKVDGLFLPNDMELESNIFGEINTQWSSDKPLSAFAHFALSSGHVKMRDELNQHQLSHWSNGEFTFTVNEQLFSSTLLLENQNETLMKVSSSVGLTEQLPVKAKVSLKTFNLKPFQAVLADVVSLQGEVSADVDIEGTLKTPIVNGNIALEKGRVLLRENANSFEKISSHIHINNNNADIVSSFYLEDKIAQLTGNFSWQKGLALNMNLAAKELPFVFPPQLTMSISPNINATLVNNELVFTGNIDVLDGLFTIEKLPTGSVSVSDDVIIIDNEGKTITHEGSGLNIKTDIRVNIAEDFSIAGQGLHSQLYGDLQVSQQGKQPLQLFGRIQSDEGTFQAYGQKLNIETGEITFNGPIDNPYLNLYANRHIKSEDIDVGITILGLADRLEMKLLSNPTMETPEILSYLVRGRGLDSGTESSTAAASFLVGFGVTNSVGLFDQIEKIPFVSNIAVDTEGEGDKTQATVSGYIGERIYMKYGIGVYEPINELTVRLFLLNRFWLEVVSGIEKSTDLYYSFDIE